MALYILERAQAYVEPFVFLLIALYSLSSFIEGLDEQQLTHSPGTILTVFNVIFIKRRPQDLLSWSKYSDQVFSGFWLRMAPIFARRELDSPVPSLIASAHGTVLEIGPGSGNQLPRYTPSKIHKIYGIEPNKNLHPALRAAIKKAGLSDVYTVVPCGIEDIVGLKEYGVDKEEFDVVLAIQVFCSLPNPGAVASACWRLLKGGGEMVVYEHVRSGDWLVRGVQNVYQIVWPYVLAGCCINRDTATVLREAGEWRTVELKEAGPEDAWMTFPRVSGRLVKAG
ncbi:MAG: hypothetical protein Q9218_004492 [Villophora microphyllina]